jgi:hypothetical protein
MADRPQDARDYSDDTRSPSIPRHFWFMRVKEWPEAPQGGSSEIEAFAGILRTAL